MIHILYDSGVVGGEAVPHRHVRPLTPFRVKLKTGRYVHVLAGSEAEVATWADTAELAMAAPPDRITALEAELAQLRKDALGTVTAGAPLPGTGTAAPAAAPRKRTRRAK